MRKLTLFVLCLVLVAAVTPASAQRCDNVKIRLWVGKDTKAPTWHARGGTLEVQAGEWARIMVYVDGAGKVPSTTQAQIGFKADVGLSGGPGAREVRELIQISPQSAADKQEGRITLEAIAPGRTELGYRIDGVTAPDTLDAVAPGCRTGVLPIVVKASGQAGGGDSQAGVDQQMSDQALRKCQNLVRNRIVDEARQAASAEPGGVTLYQGANYQGKSQRFVKDQPRMSGTDVGNDRVSSIRVSPGCKATLYAGANYSGKAIEVTRDTPQASRLGLNDQVSSLQVVCAAAGAPVDEVKFEDGARTSPSGREFLEVTGAAMVRSAGRWDRYSYECAYDTRRGEVTEVDYSID